MNSAVILGLVAIVLAVAEAWPSMYDNEFKRWSLSRRSYCQGSGKKCYSTSDCCTNYVCAAFDDFGMEPTMPGFCVHEKDLSPCVDSYDCDEGKECTSLGEHKYCVPAQEGGNAASRLNAINGFAKTGKKGLGQACKHSSECAEFASDGKQMCCQSVKRGRYGKKVMCDRRTGMSTCIGRP